MISAFEKLPKSRNVYTPILSRLGKIYASMDKAYQAAAENYGFYCAGCEDSCCMTRFYHHTNLEYLYLYEGFIRMDTGIQDSINSRAEIVLNEMKAADEKGTALRTMCPLNSEGRCLLYDRRPMICRLHGIPHELQKPGQKSLSGPGCGAFISQCGEKKYFKFDRTPFYLEMADLENELKQALKISQRPKMTIAQMVGTWEWRV